MKILSLLLSLVALMTPTTLLPQTGAKERIKVYSHALEGNLIGDPAEREVTVYLPPSYATESSKRFPVLYMLHGFTDDDSQWFGWEEHWINLHAVLDSALAAGLSEEMIVVMPNAFNAFEGSFYSSNVIIGDWETFVTRELVAFIDSHYRTLADRNSRGLAGHSMGGYGTIRLGMKYPEIYSALYLLSACCLEGKLPTNPELIGQAAAVGSTDELEAIPFMAKVILASSATWAPNPAKPPLYLDFPYENGEILPDIESKIVANRTLYIIDQYIKNLKKVKAIGLDAGTEDRGIHAATVKLHEVLKAYGIAHEFESYEGNHINRIADRIHYKVLPFFSEHLEFE